MRITMTVETFSTDGVSGARSRDQAIAFSALTKKQRLFLENYPACGIRLSDLPASYAGRRHSVYAYNAAVCRTLTALFTRWLISGGELSIMTDGPDGPLLCEPHNIRLRLDDKGYPIRQMGELHSLLAFGNMEVSGSRRFIEKEEFCRIVESIVRGPRLHPRDLYYHFDPECRFYIDSEEETQRRELLLEDMARETELSDLEIEADELERSCSQKITSAD